MCNVSPLSSFNSLSATIMRDNILTNMTGPNYIPTTINLALGNTGDIAYNNGLVPPGVNTYNTRGLYNYNAANDSSSFFLYTFNINMNAVDSGFTTTDVTRGVYYAIRIYAVSDAGTTQANNTNVRINCFQVSI